jgi:uncharacterized membrane protein YdjX (TVP38/TMEM64 family)
LGLIVKVVAAGVLMIAIALLWHFVPLADPKTVRSLLAAAQDSPAAPALVIAAFLAGGFVMFPVVVLIGATAAVFGPWFGFVYAALGALVSALATYAVGRLIGKRTLRDLLGPRLNRLRQRVARRGIVTVAAVRLVPIAPYTVINLVAGASGIPLFDFAVGTVLGILPGLVAISAVGHELARIVTAPSPRELTLLALAVVAWIALSLGLQVAVSRYWSRAR